MIKAKVTILAQGAYCAITEEKPGQYSALDVLLPAGKGSKEGLIERATEYERKAARYARYAQLCRDAAGIV